uniref:Ribosome biogenesis protein WDR12 homolog n=1 Tax=Steinernema glaseri TaxID=37863 RepID=A0A1I7YMJ0_9BILA
MDSSDSNDLISDFEPSDDELQDEGNVPHFTISFYSNDEEIKEKISDSAISVPSTSDSVRLNSLLNKNIEAVDDLWEDKTFDFLIGTNFLRASLDDFVEITGISTESIIKIECIVREPAPEPDQDLPHGDWVGSVQVTDKIIVSSSYDGHLYCWTHDGKQLLKEQICEEPIKCIDVGSDNRVYVGSQNQIVYIYELNVKGKVGALKVEAVPVATLRGHERSVDCVAVNKEGKRLVSGGFDHYLKVWNIEPEDESTEFVKPKEVAKKRKTTVVTKTPMVTLAGHRDAVVAAKWTPLNDKHVVTASWDHDIAVWDLELAGQITKMNSPKAFTALSVNPFNGTLLSGSTDPTVRLWDPRSTEGSMVKQSFMGHGGWVSGVCWSSTKDHLFVSASFDKTVRMWDVRSAKTPLYSLKGHTDRVLCCDWSHAEIIASGSVDTTLKTYRRS